MPLHVKLAGKIEFSNGQIATVVGHWSDACAMILAHNNTYAPCIYDSEDFWLVSNDEEWLPTYADAFEVIREHVK
jgi:hypothetical protein